ncbi:putative callose synthase 8 [Acorus gramineus]|uniref:1,3-beta-glucan synthase n=1 Tax=Acorus gramineus TaxID=55184 RepID=A0AAV9A3K6_ACOGR|nr:putative callose synthase 8 [Acorus gramineus]KAK1258816.1 putative callose synthase 8 [Acorus gramineus]
MKKLLKNYVKWCKFLGRRSNTWLPPINQQAQQYKLLYTGLYLLIWGEASNLRFMPECLCYIFHHMAYELHGLLSGAISLNTGERVVPVYGGSTDSFLNNVVTPLYKVISEEAQKNSGASDHSKWRNYDDLNEYFWSYDCFKIGWPMRPENDFFWTKWLGKTNFVEIHSFGMIFRSFSRMWTFFILAFQAMIIMAWHDLKSLHQLFDARIFHDVMSIFITSAGLRLIQEILAIAFTWRARYTISMYQILRHVLSILIAAMWVITLPVYFVKSGRLDTCSPKQERGTFGKYIETSNSQVCKIISWWKQVNLILPFHPVLLSYILSSQSYIIVQPQTFVGRGMQECQVSRLKYTIFWLILLLSKFSFSYHFEIKPLMEPTKQIMKISVSKYGWHEFFPKVKTNVGVILAIWAPIVLVYFMDTQIWYSIFCTIFGGIYGIFHHLGEIHTMGMLRSRFQSLPSAFNVCLTPASSKRKQKGKVVGLLQNKLLKVPKDEKGCVAKFALVWNQIISSFRSEDLINNREMDLMTMPPSSDFSSGSVGWPVFLLGNKQVHRLLFLLTAKESAMEIPRNLEARRRISFFANSLFMDMPAPPKVRNMLSFSVLTPYFMEEVNFSEDELLSTQDGTSSIIFYMQKIYPGKCSDWDHHHADETMNEEVRKWASFRGQTLSRTVRGMMYYRKALKLQAFLDMADDKGKQEINSPLSLSAHLDALADIKFTYIISCQMFRAHNSSGDPHAQDILDLMREYPSLRVAYIEETEEIKSDIPHKVYYSVLAKAVNNFLQEIYRIKLPGPPNIGEGKPENQNHAIIFTRGDALQTIDMNQDNYMEEALKMRNVLQEFLRLPRQNPPTILGLREHIFTGSVSSLAGFMSYQETSFVTIGQRLLANPLNDIFSMLSTSRVRFHYGHPDIFDRVFHLTRGGISKASRTINLSEDVFAGFNSTLRQGFVTYHEYMQVGKGRDVGLNQISKFEAKVANGNAEQTLSRDIYRLGQCFDFFRMLSCYFTTIGFYFNNLITVFGVYVFLYGKLYLVLSGLETALLDKAGTANIKSLETALASQSFIQLGLLTGLPMVMEVALEKGFRIAMSDFILMQLQLASVFFTFSLGTKSHYYGRTILHGGAKYRPTGRKFVVFHASFTENYRLYSRSHFLKGFELLLLLIIYNTYKPANETDVTHALVMYSIWFMTGSWLFAPFLFNPSGFAWRKIVEDWIDWKKWMRKEGGIGAQQDKSWESWWNDEQAHLKHTSLCSRIVEILLSLRFFIYQYGLVYHLKISSEDKNIVVYILSWIVIFAIFLLVKAVNVGHQRLSVRHHLWFRLFKAFLFLGMLSIVFVLFVICKLSIMDLILCFLAFVPTGWGILLISLAIRAKIEDYRIWDFAQALAQAYDYGMGFLLFVPIAALAWMPVISSIQTRVLFNQAFNRQLQIQPILAGRNKRR